jgi:solute carrier family 45 protein 1/2/4
VLVVSTLTLAYCKQLAAFLVDLFNGGQGDWDPKRADYISNTAIGLAVASFYLLDFALNALQASLRNLLLDITPADQLNVGNAWHSRMTQAGNIIGYGFGFFPLEDIPVLKWIGGSQFRKFCIIVLVVLVITVWITCWTQEERERPKKQVGSRSVVIDHARDTGRRVD